MLSKTRNKIARVVITSLSCILMSQIVVQCTPKPLPKVSEVPNNATAIDAAIKRLQRAKEGLEGREYITDDDAMSHEFNRWMDYQGDINKESDIQARIQQIQKEIDELKAKKAQLTK